MKWKKVAISIFSLAMVGVTAEAALIDGIKETVEEDNIKNISVYGQLPENKIKNPMKNQVTLEVLYPGMSEESFLEKPKNEVVKYMAQTTADDSGKYNFDFKMDGVSGKYLVRIGYFGGASEGQSKMVFEYVSPTEFVELFKKIDEALANDNGVELKEVIDDFTERGIISVDKYEELKAAGKDTQSIFDYMAKLDKINDITELNGAFLDGYAYLQIDGIENLEGILKDEELAEIFAIPEGVQNMYNNLEEKRQKEIFSSAKEKTENKNDFVSMLADSTVKSTFEDILWQEVYGAVYDNNSLFSIDFSEYEALSKKKQEYALKYFADNSKKVVDVDSVKAVFDESIKKGKNYKEPSKGGGGGGYSGGYESKGSGVMSSVTPEVTEKIDDLLFVAPQFDDLGSVEWAREAIETLSKNKIVNGKSEGKFFPEDTVKREEFVKMIVEMFDLYGDFHTSEFIDVNDDEWYSEYIIAASENGIIKGISPYKFGVGENIKRKDMAVIIYRILQTKGILFESKECDFSDVSKDYAESAIAGLLEKKIMNGVSEGVFAPDKNATRAEAAVLMYNVMKYLNLN